MKNMCALTLMIICINVLSAQQTQPKVRYSAGFFTTRYEIGDKDVKQPDVLAHFEKTYQPAYYDFRRGMSLEMGGMVGLLVGSVGLLTGVLANEPGVQIAGYSTGLVGYSYSLIALLSSGAKKEKAINAYNKNFGY